jgi:hypothetical protein
MTREAGASTSGQRHARASEVHPPPPDLSMLGTMCAGAWKLSALDLFLTHLLWANRTQRHSPWTSQRCRDRGRPPEPWIQAKPRHPSIAQEKTSPLEPSHPPNYGPSSGPIGLGPVRGRTYALAFFPSTPWTDADGLIPTCRQEIGYFSLQLARCQSVHLIDNAFVAEQVARCQGPKGNVSRSPYVSCFPAWGKGVNSCDR